MKSKTTPTKTVITRVLFYGLFLICSLPTMAQFITGKGSAASPNLKSLAVDEEPFKKAPLMPIFEDIGAGLPSLEYSSVEWGDYNNDGFLDALIIGFPNGGRVSRVYRNNGDDTFTNINAGLLQVDDGDVAWGDYDNDGDLDILLTGGAVGIGRSTRLYRNNGDDTFTDINAGLENVSRSAVDWGDYDNDGFLDILVTGLANSSTAGSVSAAIVYHNNGDGTFTDANVGLTGVFNSSSNWGDYDNDGDLDILLTGFTGVSGGSQRVTLLYRNNGNGTFTDTNVALPAVTSGAAAWGDYDNDGFLDIVLSGFSSVGSISRVYRNNGNGTFTDSNAGLPGVLDSSLDWGDYNNDGNLDLLLTGDTDDGNDPTTLIYENNGDGTFTELTTILQQVYLSAAAWGDFDNDGDLDILISGYTDPGKTTRIYRNLTVENGGTTNAVPTIPTGLSATVLSDGVLFDWTPATDAETPQDGLSYNIYIKENPVGTPEYVKTPMAQEADGWRKLPALGNAMQNTSYTWKTPDSYCGSSTNFEVSVQAIDHNFAGSPFSGAATFSLDLAASGNVIYVDASASGNDDGSSWANAFTNLQDAFNGPTLCSSANEIWVAAGTYKPGTGQADSFVIPENKILLGGFLGNETNADARDWAANRTFLSGDLNGSNNSNAGDSHSIVTIVEDNITIDGFVIENAYADNPADGSLLAIGRTGAGIYANGATNLQINNSIFHNLVAQGNGSSGVGAAVINFSTDTTLNNCLFFNNRSTGNGGAISGESGSIDLINCTIANNEAAGSGGGIHLFRATVIATNSIFTNNSGTNGNINDGGNGSATVSNSIFFNTLGTNNGNIPVNVIDGGNNLTSTDPSYNSITNINGYQLRQNSPAINVGIDNGNLTPKDLGNNNRILGSNVDIGAYEAFSCAAFTSNVVFVNENASGNNDGSSWTNAFTDLQDAISITACPVINEIWVAAGTYTPGNTETDSFRVPDGITVLGGFVGAETDAADRNWGINPTILSGDLDNSNTPTINDSHSIMTVASNNVVVDGFIFENSFADGPESNPFVSGRTGGGLYNNGNNSVINCIFRNNSAQIGGGLVSFGGTLELINSLFFNNDATSEGGALSCQGGTFNLINTTLANNTAVDGGAIHNFNTTLNVASSIFSENTATGANPNINTVAGTTTINYSYLQGEAPSGTFNLDGNTITDPLFTDASKNDYTLQNNSPGLEAGDDDQVTVTRDLAGNPRRIDVNANGVVSVDMGAYELQVISITPDANNILYVNTNVSGGNGSGDSWDNAIPELADALVFAKNNEATWTNTDPLQIWVAVGTYNPLYSADDSTFGSSTGRENTFLMVNNVQLYGGFDPANGVVGLSDIRILPASGGAGGGTILSGDIGTPNNNSDNTLHVVVSADNDDTALLNGFTLTNGNANLFSGGFTVNGRTINGRSGGGIYNYESLLSLTNVSISNNSSSFDGGGMYNLFGAPTITNSIISGNSTDIDGGGIYNNESSPTITNSTISGNTAAAEGGGMYNDTASPTLTNVVISENSANGDGGGIYTFNDFFNGSASTYTNCLFANNNAGIGGGAIFYDDGDGNGPVFTNCSFSGNSATTEGNLFFYLRDGGATSPQFNNSILMNPAGGLIIEGFGASIDDIVFQNNLTNEADLGNNSVNTDNIFDTTAGYTDPANGDYTLLPDSPAVGAGSNALYTTAGGDLTNDLDLAGNPRLQATNIDLGAFEAVDTEPTAICTDFTAQLDANGSVTILPSDVDDGSFDAETDVTLSLDIDTFDCADIGDNTVTLTVEDETGNTATCTATVTVEDNIIPTVVTQDITVQLDANGAATITPEQINDGSTDNCTADTDLVLSLDITSFDCDDIGAPQTVTLTVEDESGNSGSATATVTVEDIMAPTVVTQNITVQLDANGEATITAGDINDGSSDNCTADGDLDLALDITMFDCDDVGANTVTLTVTDESGNSDTGTATVTVEDNIPPTAFCPADITQDNDPGECGAVVNFTIPAPTDNCVGATTTASPASGSTFPVGTTAVTVTATDASGNTNMCTFDVTVEDNEDPVAVCAPPIRVNLGSSGSVSITPADLDGGSIDNCSVSLSISQDTFTCTDLGINLVTLTATDPAGNSTSCNTFVTVEDDVQPTAQCVAPIILQLDDSGQASITSADIDGGSTDACGIGTADISIDRTDFTCDDIGDNLVTLTIIDAGGNTSSCFTTVTVIDSLAPVLTCPADQAVAADANGEYIFPDYFATGEALAEDNCTAVPTTTQIPAPGSILPVGNYTVRLTAVDANGNTADCSFEVVVETALGVDGFDVSNISLYPNPVESALTIDNPDGLVLKRAVVYDLTGRMVRSADLRGAGTRTTIDISELASATYIVVVTGDGGTLTKQIVKE